MADKTEHFYDRERQLEAIEAMTDEDLARCDSIMNAIKRMVRERAIANHSGYPDALNEGAMMFLGGAITAERLGDYALAGCFCNLVGVAANSEATSGGLIFDGQLQRAEQGLNFAVDIPMRDKFVEEMKLAEDDTPEFDMSATIIGPNGPLDLDDLPDDVPDGIKRVLEAIRDARKPNPKTLN